MRRSLGGRVVLILSLFALVVGLTPTAKAKPPVKPSTNDTVIHNWAWTINDEKDKFIEKGNWTVKGFVIFNGANKRTGTYEMVSETHVKLDMTDGRLKGFKIDLYKEKESTVNWKGEVDTGKNRIYKILVSFKK
jgi:hypothetical protein